MKESEYIGEMASESLVIWEELLWEWEVREMGVPRFTDEGFRAAMKIFMAAFVERSYAMMNQDKMPTEDRHKMIVTAGEELSKFVHTYTGIDTKKLYK